MDEFLPILGFGIGGYRSFGEDVQRFGPCAKINLIIGQNNSGKSNALYFLQHRYACLAPQLAYLARTADAFPALGSLDRHMSSTDCPIQFSVGVPVMDEVRQRWHRGMPPARIAELLGNFEPCGSGVWLDFHLAPGENRLSPTKEIIRAVSKAIDPLQEITIAIYGTVAPGTTVQEQCARTFIDDILRTGFQKAPCLTIPAIRRPGTDEYNQSLLAGEDLVHRLGRLQNPHYNEQRLREGFSNVEKFLRSVTDRADARLEIPYARDTVLVHMDGRSLPLNALGTGIHEVVILAAIATVLNEHVICIEEPEVHLHPVLQRKLIRYLEQETHNQYFISTHSAHILNQENASIFHVKLEHGVSVATVASTSHELFSICQDLGYQASDLLQSNCVIWVEGPSDRIYLRAWIELLRDDLVEGVHYSIMFYGGRLLNHLSPDDAEVSEFISLRKLNRHSCIVMDSDKRTARTPINKTKRRIVETWGSHSGFPWVTAGREIENYVDPEAMLEALQSVATAKSHKLNPNKYSPQIPKDNGSHAVANKLKVAHWLVENKRLSLERLDLRKRIVRLCLFIDTANQATQQHAQ